MRLELVEALSLPSGAVNEDAFGHSAGAAVVIDGSTNLGEALMPGGNDAAWLARFGARRLIAHAGEDKGPRKALRDALGDAEKSFTALRRAPPEAMWQLPSASMMLAMEAGSSGAGRNEAALEFLWFGDCAALLQRPGEMPIVIGDSLESRAAEAGRAALLAREKGLDPAAGINRPEFLAPLRAARSRINNGGNWRFSPDAGAASHAARRTLDAPPGSLLLLASDGFLALVSDYGAYDMEGLMDAARFTGLQPLGDELRAIEHNDPRGTQFPRFKKSDDATALLLKMA